MFTALDFLVAAGGNLLVHTEQLKERALKMENGRIEMNFYNVGRIK